MQDILATSFVVFVLAFYSIIALVFVIGAIRKWIWRPIAKKISARHPDKSYHRFKSTSHEGSPS